MARISTKERLITGYLFDDLTAVEREQFDELVGAGQIDTVELEELRRALSIASLLESEEPPRRFWDNYYESLLERIGPRRSRPTIVTRTAKWLSETFYSLGPRARFATRAAFAVAVLVVGVLLGRTVLAPGSGETVKLTMTEVAPETHQVATAAHEYFGRSKVLLLGIVHAENGDADDLNLSRRREMARELVRTAADLKPSLDNAELRRLHELVSEIEVILLQVANLEAEYDLPAIEMVRDGVERKGLLFKINVEEMRLPEANDERAMDASNQTNDKRSQRS